MKKRLFALRPAAGTVWVGVGVEVLRHADWGVGATKILCMEETPSVQNPHKKTKTQYDCATMQKLRWLAKDAGLKSYLYWLNADQAAAVRAFLQSNGWNSHSLRQTLRALGKLGPAKRQRKVVDVVPVPVTPSKPKARSKSADKSQLALFGGEPAAGSQEIVS